jgi:hypothetical protein
MPAGKVLISARRAHGGLCYTIAAATCFGHGSCDVPNVFFQRQIIQFRLKGPSPPPMAHFMNYQSPHGRNLGYVGAEVNRLRVLVILGGKIASRRQLLPFGLA